ncbi:glycosyltransferase family 2 protein [Tunturiibacter lichenicola]|uniref:glycosyltransferase family 2 protein n=1 Tax=Tunturiibacter lichenicola TaxID=2051959 RepID=UPI0021B1ABF4|nr:glycosyltransferase family 2 protein [Edaphobacter lichenicola]
MIVPNGSSGMMPLISIVTPSFNQAAFIYEAIQSIKIQDYAMYEHLIIDGMSTDGTVELLQTLSSIAEFNKMSWMSEKDNGQSEALNKGFRRAKGDIIGWLNSDDRYLPGCFAHIVEAFEQNPDVDIIYGDYRIVDEHGRAVQTRREIEFSKFILFYHHVLYIPTTATFFRSRVFKEENWLEEHLQYAMDLELFIRLAIKGYRFMHISKVLADFRLQPNSKTCSSPDKQRMEHKEIVYAAAPALHPIDSPRIRSLILLLLRSIAFIRRSAEKLLRGYYWNHKGSLPHISFERVR